MEDGVRKGGTNPVEKLGFGDGKNDYGYRIVSQRRERELGKGTWFMC